MSKLKELLDKYAYQTGGVYSLIDIEELCKEYAELFREKILEGVECSEESWSLIKESITNIELP